MMFISEPPGRSSRDGFSLPEVIVVVGIVSIVATFGTWEIVRRKPVADLNRAAWEISTQLRRARLQAISRNEPCEISFNTTDLTCTSWTDDDGDGAIDDGESFTSDLSDIPELYMWVWPQEACTFDSRGHITTSSWEDESGETTFVNLQYVYLFIPEAGGKLMYIYQNGQVDLRDQ
jgi:prepilin-type N-terminal cleavage/methylation domain-containing protein